MYSVYYTVIKHSGHLRTLKKWRKHSPAALVFYISLLFSNDHRVLSQRNTRLRLLYLLINKPTCRTACISPRWKHQQIVQVNFLITNDQNRYCSWVTHWCRYRKLLCKQAYELNKAYQNSNSNRLRTSHAIVIITNLTKKHISCIKYHK